MTIWDLIRPVSGDALLIVDVQNDFLPGGSLPVPGGDRIIDPLNRLIGLFTARGLPVVATRDWHPGNHLSFVEQGGAWPVHCVQNTSGAAFSNRLGFPSRTVMVSKAESVDRDAFSGFEGTDLHDQLVKLSVRRLFVGGLATDYCVLETVVSAHQLGYDLVLVTDAIRSIDTQAGDGEKAIERMVHSGAQPVGSSRITG